MNNKKRWFTILLSVLLVFSTFAQEKTTFSINSNWFFLKGSATYPEVLNEKNWEKVQIPHSWNKDDVNDDLPGYYRGVGWYTKTLNIPKTWENRDIYLLFEGANQTAEVFVNGKKAGSHIGGYTAFTINITPFVKFGDENNNEITVKVDNSYQADIPPLTADFTFFGGLYRDVFISAVAKTHFEIDQYGGKGVFITTPLVTNDKATVKIKGRISKGMENEVIVTATIIDQNDKIATQQQKLKLNADKSFEINFQDIKNPKLWSPDTPNLYQVITTISDKKTGKIIDEISNPLGFRWFTFDAEKGFFLNGKPLKLIGASRHQDFKRMANAVPDEIAVNDVHLLKEMGGNFLRVAHYPQDPVVLETCDRLGILASVEIPIVNAITESEAFYNNCKDMQREMIRQNFNHPSVIIWAYMNEILLRPPFGNDKDRREIYFKNVAKLALQIEDVTRSEDPSRYTMIPNHGSFELYNRVGLTKIPMLVGWNLYQGWYGGKLDGFATYLDMHHKELPDKPLLVTEYGADADNRIHSNNPVRFDKSVEYAIDYHQVYLKAMLDRPFVAAGIAWNLADFSSEERTETDPSINNKGLLTIDRKPKDSYLFYQANLLTKPFLKIGLSDRNIVGGIANANDLLEQQLKVYSNQKSISLTVNGKKLDAQPTKMGFANFTVPLRQGENTLIATAGEDDTFIQDQINIKANLIPEQLASQTLPFDAINVSVGDSRYFLSEENKQLWLPDKEYKAGSWGYVGGKVFQLADTARQSFGSNIAISGTLLDPVYQTQRVGITDYNFDVPDGKYELTLHFAELLSTEEQKTLAYNLSDKAANKDQFTERLFNITINGKPAIERLGNKNELKSGQAVSYTIPIIVTNQSGIKINFKPILGETILNGIQLKKCY